MSAETRTVFDPTRINQIDPVTRAGMAAIEREGYEWVIPAYHDLVAAAQQDYALASTVMAHLTHAEVRTILATLVGHDAEATR